MLEQTVDLKKYSNAIDKGKVSALFSFKVRSYKQDPGDKTRVQLVFHDARGRAVGQSYDSGAVRYMERWKKLGDKVKVPPKSRSVKVVLTSIRVKKGKQVSNDGHFDDLSLKLKHR